MVVASKRSKAFVAKDVVARHFDVEFTVARLSPFFCKSDVFTVFPDLLAFERQHVARTPRGASSASPSDEDKLHVYVLFVFQAFKGSMVTGTSPALEGSCCGAGRAPYRDAEAAAAAGAEEGGDGDAAAATAGLPSTMIPYDAEVSEFKDESREVFNTFMEVFHGHLHRCATGHGDPDASEAPAAFTTQANRAEVYREGYAAARGLPLSFTPDGPSQGGSGGAEAEAGRRASFWLDWCDPATGLPMHSERGSTIFCDSDAIEQMIGLSSVLVAGSGGGCRLITHPVYGINLYTSSAIVACSDERVLQRALAAMGPTPSSST